MTTKATNALKLLVGEVFTNQAAMHSTPPLVAIDALSHSALYADELTKAEGKAFAKAFLYKPLRLVVRLFWLVYRFGRATNAIPAASDEPWN